VPLRQSPTREDEPARVPAAGDRARLRRRAQHHGRPLRVHARCTPRRFAAAALGPAGLRAGRTGGDAPAAGRSRSARRAAFVGRTARSRCSGCRYAAGCRAGEPIARGRRGDQARAGADLRVATDDDQSGPGRRHRAARGAGARDHVRAGFDAARPDQLTEVPVSTIAPSRYVPYGFARTNQLLVAGLVGETTEVWIGERTPRHALAELARLVPMRLVTVRKGDEALSAAISRAYSQQEGSAAAVVDELESDLDLSRLMQDLPKIEDLLEAEDDAPIIRMINVLLTQAARDGASDIHIEPFETHSLVRFRVDGTLRDVVRPRRERHAALVSRIKIMAQLDIAEKRLPQDGRITLRIGGRPMDVRVSTLPTGHGERAVLRLLDKEAGRLDLAKLGMAPDTLATFDRLTRQPHGILLDTGPTGSGKTTTLYA